MRAIDVRRNQVPDASLHLPNFDSTSKIGVPEPEGANDFQLVLDYDQLKRLRAVIETPVLITGRAGDQVPTLRVRPLDLVRAVRDRLRRDGISMRDIRLNGGAASYVLGGGFRGGLSPVELDDHLDADEVFRSECRRPAYNDLDLIFCVQLSGPDDQERVRDAVLSVLPEFLTTSVDDAGNHRHVSWTSSSSPASPSSSSSSSLTLPIPSPSSYSGSSSSASSTRSSTPTSPTPTSPLPPSMSLIGHAYVHKMFRIYAERGDRWSLISLSNVRGRSVELKFTDVMRRQFQFSVDSFQIILDGLLSFHDAIAPISCGTTASATRCDVLVQSTQNFYPTVLAESAYGRISDALDHLRRKLIVTRRPEEIRGGGLLKYCSLLVRGYRTLPGSDVSRLERYMCSRFFIDFPRTDEQRTTLDNYIAEHFVNADDRRLRLTYLSTLCRVIDTSAVRGPIVMGFSSPERAATMHVVRQMALDVLAEERMMIHQHHHHQAMMMMTSPGMTSPLRSPVEDYVEQRPSEEHLIMKTHNPVRLQPRRMWVCTRQGTVLSPSPMSQPSTPSTEPTSLMLLDTDGNELIVERIEYGPHPLPLRSVSPVPTSQAGSLTSPPVMEDPGVPSGPFRMTQDGDASRSSCGNSSRSPLGHSERETVPDQFFVVYTFDTVSDRGGTGAVAVRSCVPLYAVSNVPFSCCSPGRTIDGQRTSAQNG